MKIIDESYRAFVNLDHRKDRLKLMRQELAKVGIQAERFPGLKPAEVIDHIVPAEKVEVMNKRTPGAIGCHYSQVAVMLKALSQNKHAFVMEDDLIFCDDFKERMEIMEEFLEGKEWDIIWLGGTYHIKPEWHNAGHPQLKECSCNLNRDVEKTENQHIVMTFGCWSTYAYIVNKNSLERILQMMEERVHLSMGIDWLMILIQPMLKTYAFVPGCVRQHDNRSDIGNGTTYFSHFYKLGNHWYQDNMKNFDYGAFKI